MKRTNKQHYKSKINLKPVKYIIIYIFVIYIYIYTGYMVTNQFSKTL